MVEKERSVTKDRVIEEMKQQNDGQMRDMEGQIAMRKQELDNIKRAYDEQHYENENLRKQLNMKNEELSQVNRMLS